MTADKAPPCIHNTPAYKIQLRDEIHGLVYERFYTKYRERLGQILSANQALRGDAFPGFTYKGTYYGYEPALPQRQPTPAGNRVQMHAWRQTVHVLHSQRLEAPLQIDMEQLLADQRAIESEESPLMRGMLTSVLNSTGNFDDYKRLLPQMVHPILDQWQVRCSCAVQSLTDEQIKAVLAKHGKYINLITQRQLLYIIAPP